MRGAGAGTMLACCTLRLTVRRQRRTRLQQAAVHASSAHQTQIMARDGLATSPGRRGCRKEGREVDAGFQSDERKLMSPFGKSPGSVPRRGKGGGKTRGGRIHRLAWRRMRARRGKGHPGIAGLVGGRSGWAMPLAAGARAREHCARAGRRGRPAGAGAPTRART